MNSFQEWCWKENEEEQPRLSQEDLLSIAKQLSKHKNIDKGTLERMMDQKIPDSLKQEIERSPEYQNAIKELMENPLFQQKLRENVVDNLEDKLDSDIDYKRFKYPEQEIKEGSRVKIRRDSEFANQNEGIGTMQGDFGSDAINDRGSWAGVNFDDGYKNTYRKQDLEPEEKFSKEELEQILRQQNEELMKQISQTSFNQFRQDMEYQTQEKIDSGEEMSQRKSKKFQVGDKIIMNKEANERYSITREGSEGEVIQPMDDDGDYKVKFTKLSGNPSSRLQNFSVRGDYMNLLETLKEQAERRGGSQKMAEQMVDEAIKSAMEKMTEKEMERIKKRKMDELRERFIGELKGKNLFRQVRDEGYEVNQLELLEILGKNEFEEAMEMASFKKKPAKTGKHRSKLNQQNGISAKYKKTNRVSSGLAVLPTMRNSITRRAADRTGPVLHEDDLAVFDSEKKVSYAVEFLVDANKCVTKTTSGTKKAALSLYYMMKKFYPGDKYEFIKFNDDAEVISLDELLTMNLGGCRDSGKAVDLAIDRLNKHKGRQRVMYLISDGNPCGWGKGSERESGLLEKARELKKKDIQLVVMALCNENSSFYSYAQEVAKEAGGLVYLVPDAEKLSAHLIQSYKDLRKGK